MVKIADIFKAESSSVQETFHCHGGVAGFRIPIYQRRYDWGRENIERLFEDVVSGLVSLSNDEQSLTFLGTVILVNDGKGKEATFDGRSLNVVDGQQRLTTLVLVFSELLRRISHLSGLVGIQNVDAAEWIKAECEYILDHLFSCFLGSPSGPAKDKFHYFPRVVRQNKQYGDNRGSNKRDAVYLSPVGQYLFDLGTAYNEGKLASFKFNPRFVGEDYEKFNDNLQIIRDQIDVVMQPEEEQEFPAFDQLISRANYKALFNKITDHNQFNRISSYLKKNSGDEVQALIATLAFGNYFLNHVVMTRVEADEERRAFDIFDALNTTGQPLTALETLKPYVVQFEEDEAGYENSESADEYDVIDKHLAKYLKPDDRQKESKEIVVNFGLYLTGKKLLEHLGTQRNYLRNTYRGITGNDVQEKKSNARIYMRSLADIVRYRQNFWDNDGILSCFREHAEGEMLRLCLQLIKDMKTKLTIPILARYQFEAASRHRPELFIDALKALTAFLVIRRAATGGTAGIDTDFRNLMARGHRDKSQAGEPLCLAVDQGNEIEFIHSLPEVEDFRVYLRSYLAAPRLKISTKEDWIKQMSVQPLGDKAKELCRFLLLTAAHHAVESGNGLLRKERKDTQKDYMQHAFWVSPKFESVEHIAPRSPREEKNGWDPSIYSDAYTVDTIGNLALLPRGENSKVGNNSWPNKKLFYLAFAAETQEELEKVFKEADRRGVSFGPKVREFLRGSSRLPIMAAVSKVDNWNRAVIQKRSQNIGELVWSEIARWLGL